MKHEDFVVVFEGKYEAAAGEQRQQFLLELCGETDVDCGFECVLERFEDTRTEQEVNDMLRAFAHIGMPGWVWSDEGEVYTLAVQV